VPLVGAAAFLGLNEWRSRRRPNAGWILVGLALPWAVLWGLALAFDPTGAAALRFGIGALPTALGLVIVGATSSVASAPSTPTAASAATTAIAASAPTSGDRPAPGRSFLVVAQAIRAASWLGPVPLPELAAVSALAVVDLVAALATAGQPPILRVVVISVVGSAIASEAYFRAMAPATRRALEALSWLGDAELREVRAATGHGVPRTAFGARRWLGSHPPRTDDSPLLAGLRVQLLLMAGRVAGAATLADALVASPPNDAADAHERLALRELVGWWRGEPSRVPGLRAAEEAIEPVDGDPRLRAEVGTAVAEVRRRAVGEAPTGGLSDPGVLEPLLRARDRLGSRVDGLLRRTLWRPIFGLFLVASLAFGLVALLTGTVGP
jgi:hypothetical protein